VQDSGCFSDSFTCYKDNRRAEWLGRGSGGTARAGCTGQREELLFPKSHLVLPKKQISLVRLGVRLLTVGQHVCGREHCPAGAGAGSAWFEGLKRLADKYEGQTRELTLRIPCFHAGFPSG